MIGTTTWLHVLGTAALIGCAEGFMQSIARPGESLVYSSATCRKRSVT